MTDGPIELGAHSRMTVEEALALSLRQSNEFQSVLIIGWDQNGEYMHRSAGLSRGDALWLVEAARQDIVTKTVDMQGSGSLFRGKAIEDTPEDTQSVSAVISIPKKRGK